MARKARPWFRQFDGWWYVCMQGKQHRLAQGRKNKAAAFQRWHELEFEAAANPSVDSPDQTVASVIDAYLVHARHDLDAETHARRSRYLQLFAEIHGFRLAQDCLPIHLTQWLDSNKEWSSAWTRATVIKIVQRVFNWAARQRLIPSNPFFGVSQRPGEPRRPMTDEEFRRVIRATVKALPKGHKRRNSPKRPTAGTRFRNVLFFLRYTGARPSEMSSLTWDAVDFEHGVTILTEHKTRKLLRTPRPRIIQMVPEVAKLLKRIKRQEQFADPHVFLSSQGRPWRRDMLGLRLRRFRNKAGVGGDATLYGIRHQFGTMAVVNGVDIKTLAELMGHRSTQMTEHYCHLAGHQAHLAAAMKRAVAPRSST
jgi:integrase